MDVGALGQTIWSQFVTAWNTPVPTITIASALWFLLRWHIRGQFHTRLANAQSTIEMLEKKLDRDDLKASGTALNLPTIPNLTPRDTSVDTGTNDQELAEQLIILYKSHTRLQSSQVMKEYYGREMTLSGSVFNVMPTTFNDNVMLSLTNEAGSSFFFFDKPSERLQALRKGDRITVSGTLKLIDDSGLEFRECAIL